MQVISSIQILEKRKNNKLFYPCIIKLQAKTKKGKNKLKEFKDVFIGLSKNEIFEKILDYYFSLFIKPADLIIGFNNKELMSFFEKKKYNNFNILKTVYKESPKNTIEKLENIFNTFIEENRKSLIPDYLMHKYEEIISDLDKENQNIQLALYLKMIINYFDQCPEKVIDNLPIYISMKDKKLLPENIETVEDFLVYISENN